MNSTTILSISTIILLSFPALHYANVEHFKIIIEPKWENLEHNENRIALFGGKWILAGSITFKKKIKDCVNLSHIILQWQGPYLEKLIGSLYEKNFEKKFYPIDDFFVCDGKWDKKTQILTLPFDRACTLQAINTFYLVLTIPHEQEHLVKKGSFQIADTCLPSQFKKQLKTTTLSLSFNTIKQQTMIPAIFGSPCNALDNFVLNTNN